MQQSVSQATMGSGTVFLDSQKISDCTAALKNLLVSTYG